MNSTHLMVVLIVAMVVIGSIFKAKYGGGTIRGRSRHWHEPPPADDAEKQRLREEVKELKERVAVLERIATDSGTSLAHEIEKLRDR